MPTATRQRCAALVVLLTLDPGLSMRSEAALTGVARLTTIYNEILAARFTRAHELAATACEPAPPEACQALDLTALWWQIVLDPENRALDSRFEAAARDTIAAATAWTAREPGRAEAWFYLAAAYAPFVQWRVIRADRLNAARDGNRIRSALERALELDPTLHDAKFGIGLYHYYADVASAGAKILRFFLLLPGGNRVDGLREMLEARQQGQLLTGEADYQMHWLYLWYEQQPDRALALLRQLDHQYPTNPVFLQRIAEIHHEYFHDYPASAAAWTALLERARRGGSSVAHLAEVNARLGLGVELDAMFETDRALIQFQAVVKMMPTEPRNGLARAQWLLGAAADRLGDRAAAVAAYNNAITAAAAVDDRDIHERAGAALRHRPDANAASAYRLSLDGWRALERGDAARAVALLAQAMALVPDDPIATYRYSRALQASGDLSGAASMRQRVINARPAAPAIVLASAYVDAATISERDGAQKRAIELYQRALASVGGAPDAHENARLGLKRLAP